MSAPAVLVTGGAGFVGSHACKALARAGYLPIAYDDLSNGIADAVRWGPLEVGKIEDERRLTAVFKKYEPASVMHFAARIEAGESFHEPANFYNINVGGTLNLLQCMRSANVDKIIFSSTAAVHGNPHSIPIAEDQPRHPISPYGRSKLMGETLLSDFAAAYGVRYVIFRYFNASGADPDGDLGERHDPETHLIPLVLQAAYGLHPPITVFGDDYDTPDGTCIRDYVHVSDLTTAHVRGLNRLMSGGYNLTANLGSGQGHSVFEVIETTQTVTGRLVPFQIASRRLGDPAVLVASIERAKAELDWLPLFSDLQTQIVDAAGWLEQAMASRSGISDEMTAPQGIVN